MTNAEAIRRADARRDFYVMWVQAGRGMRTEGAFGEDMAFARAHELVAEGQAPKVVRVMADFES